jgi:hypothetical protein
MVTIRAFLYSLIGCGIFMAAGHYLAAFVFPRASTDWLVTIMVGCAGACVGAIAAIGESIVSAIKAGKREKAD